MTKVVSVVQNLYIYYTLEIINQWELNVHVNMRSLVPDPQLQSGADRGDPEKSQEQLLLRLQGRLRQSQ